MILLVWNEHREGRRSAVVISLPGRRDKGWVQRPICPLVRIDLVPIDSEQSARYCHFSG